MPTKKNTVIGSQVGTCVKRFMLFDTEHILEQFFKIRQVDNEASQFNQIFYYTRCVTSKRE